MFVKGMTYETIIVSFWIIFFIYDVNITVL